MEQLSVGDISENLKITPSAASQHLKILKNSGILKFIKKGFFKYYIIDKTELEGFRADINELFDRAYLKDDDNCKKLL